MKRNVVIWAFALSAVLIAVLCFHTWKADAPRREALSALQDFSVALNSNNSSDLLGKIVLPQALQGRTEFEQVEFLRKALHDEISDEGVASLRAHGQFGPLKALFPKEAEAWATQAGVKADDCVALRMERANLCAEVVLFQENGSYRVIRCNNVKQMALTKGSA